MAKAERSEIGLWIFAVAVITKIHQGEGVAYRIASRYHVVFHAVSSDASGVVCQRRNLYAVTRVIMVGVCV